MPIAVAPPSDKAHRVLKCGPPGAHPIGKIARVGIAEHRRVESLDIGDPGAPPVPEAAKAGAGSNRLAERWKVTDTDDGDSIGFEPDEHAI